MEGLTVAEAALFLSIGSLREIVFVIAVALVVSVIAIEIGLFCRRHDVPSRRR